MDKIANFLINKRLYIFIVMVVLAMGSVFLIFQTKINYDLTKYLPADSEMKKGIDLMASEFDDELTSHIRIVITGLDTTEKMEIKDLLESINPLIDVNYDESSTYNNGDYTLFYVIVHDDARSNTAKEVFQEVKTQLSEYEAYYNGEIPEAQSNFLLVLIIWGFSLLLVLLIILSKSWFEALLFIVTIGIAVLINYGTNFLFSSISEMTFSIAAVLQLVLSIDYSIMLSERYRQEKNKGHDNVTAMKYAVKKGISSISASSLTTIMGLICLIFMSFSIGQDIGLVLAKGILFSYLSTLTVLPILLITFDKTIEKTSRKQIIKINLEPVSHFGFKVRYYMLGLFVVLVAGGMILNQYVGVDFFQSSMASDSKVIEEHFPTTNEIVILYPNDDEIKIEVFENEVLLLEATLALQSYQSTLGKPLNSQELSYQTSMDEMVIKALIYQYLDGQETSLSINGFVTFIINELSTNSLFESQFDTDTLTELSMLQTYTSIPFLTADYNSTELSNLLQMEKTQVDQLILMYYSSLGLAPIETVVLYDFMGYLVSLTTDPIYSSLFTLEQINQLSMLYNIMSLGIMNESYDSIELTTLFQTFMPELDSSMVMLVYWFHDASVSYQPDWKISIDAFMSYIVTDLAYHPVFSSLIDEPQLTQLSNGYEELLLGKSQLIGPHYSRMILSNNLNLSDDDAIPYVTQVTDLLQRHDIHYHLIGNLPMAEEMNVSFLPELNFITILTIIVIFVIVAITFKSFFVPLLLVLIIQTSIYLTMSFTLIGGNDLYFLSIIIIQAILMGAAIDYAILLTNYYKTSRKEFDIKTSLTLAYKGSLPAILTSSIILIVITGILGFVIENATTASVLMTLSRGMTISILLTLIVLPPLLGLFDRFVCYEFKLKRKRFL